MKAPCAFFAIAGVAAKQLNYEAFFIEAAAFFCGTSHRLVRHNLRASARTLLFADLPE
jgi:hypothetical protein